MALEEEGELEALAPLAVGKVLPVIEVRTNAKSTSSYTVYVSCHVMCHDSPCIVMRHITALYYAGVLPA